jgi:predicted transcriptional regulator
MPEKNSIFPKIRSLVMDAVKEGIPEKKIFYDTSPNWYRYFHYESNPLDSFVPHEPLEDHLIDLFVNREVEIRIISSYFGSIKTLPYNIHIAIIGSKGIGKHTTLKIISKIIQESFPDISFEYYNLKTGKDFKNNSDLDDSEITNLDKQKLDVRLISCSGKNKWLILKRIDDYKKNTKILFTIWHTNDYPIQDNLKINKIIYFRNYNKDIITKIFKRRINKFLKEKEENGNYITSLYKNLIPSIIEAFQGNLKISFLFFEQIHQLAKVQNINEIPQTLIDELMNNYLSIKNQKITSKEKEIINYLLSAQNVKFITTSDLRDDLHFDRTVAWRYLENLTKKNILNRIKYGNPSRYKINDIFLSFYEDELKKKIIFKE